MQQPDSSILEACVHRNRVKIRSWAVAIGEIMLARTFVARHDFRKPRILIISNDPGLQFTGIDSGYKSGVTKLDLL